MTDKLNNGTGKLFTTVDPDEMRRFFKDKSKALVSKVTTCADAVSEHVNDGDYLAIGGFGGVRIPTALIHELMRQGKKHLKFSGHTATHDCQLMAAAECFDACDIAYVVGLEARGLSAASRRLFQSGRVEVTEWSNGALATRYRAAAMGVSFLPMRTMLGTDTFNYSAAREIECPFTGKTYAALPALYPDVSFVHVHRADKFGNCQIDGILMADEDLAKASKRVIVTTETIIDNAEIRREPNKTIIPYWLVDAVIEVPFGSYPGNMPGVYYSDEEHLAQWLKVERDPQAFAEFLKHHIYSSANFAEYLEKNGGIETLSRLKQKEHLLA